MGNSKSKAKEDFESLPKFKIIYYLSDLKREMNSIRMQCENNGTFEVIKLIDLIDTLLNERSEIYSQPDKGHGKSVWGDGMGFSYSNTDNVYSKYTTKRYIKESNEKEAILIHCLNIFTKYISLCSPKILKKTRKVFNQSNIKKEIEEYLMNDSILDITKHEKLYWQIWNLLISFTSLEYIRDCVYKGKIYKYMKNLVIVAESYKEYADKIPNEFEAPGILLINMILNSHESLQINYLQYLEEKPKKEELPDASTYDEKVEKKKETKEISTKKRRRKKKSKSDEISEYFKIMEPLLFDTCKFSSHIFMKKKESLSKDAMNRIMLELQSLAKSLPTCLNTSSSIYLRSDSNSMDKLKVLIIGPEDTPYSMGCFEFDFYIPCNYPKKPPLCRLATTRNNTFKFNPNLYANGKVCLSLIGTWSGPPEEQWNPQVSTLFQVFVSIQSLILVPNPFYNEPGYQFFENSIENEQYNKEIQFGTISIAILGQLKDKNNTFHDVIKTHCKLMKDKIIKQAIEWKIEQSILDELTNELNKL